VSVQLTAGGVDWQPSISGDWTMVYLHGEVGNDQSYLRLMSLADGHVASGPTNPATASPSFALGNGSVSAPPAFPIAASGSSPSPSPSSSATKPPGYQCGTIKFFGLRGSGENAWDGEGMGFTVDAVKNTMAGLIPGLKFQAVDYPAIAVQWWDPAYPANYVDSEWTGRDAFLQALRDFIRFCPTTYAVAVGYSQGAQAIGDAYAMLTDTERKHLLVLEFGNPAFNSDKSQNVMDAGNYSAKLAGILLQTGYDPQVVPGKWQTYVRSYCAKGDPVCNYQKRDVLPCITNLPTCGHLQYVSRGWTDQAARWAAGRWQRLPRL